MALGFDVSGRCIPAVICGWKGLGEANILQAPKYQFHGKARLYSPANLLEILNTFYK
jgi:hypothetical protein